MKKFLIYLLCLAILFTMFVGCGSEQAKFDCGKKAYDELLAASKICEDLGDAVYGAWYFAIYEAEDYDYNSSRLSAFASETGLSVNDINASFEALGYSSDVGFRAFCLGDFSKAVFIVIQAYENNGKIEQLNTLLSNTKTELKTMTTQYSDYDQYPTLKAFYSEVDSYASFLQSPSSSFEQLKATIESYEKSIRTYSSDLAFVFED